MEREEILMDPRNWSSYRTLHALREAGITPKVHPDGDRLALPKGQREILTEGLRAALKANHADLLRGELFRDAVRTLIARLEEAGLGDDHPARDAVYGALGESGAEERLNDAWTDGRLGDFKAALEAWASPAYRALEAASLSAHKAAAARPPAPGTPAHDDDEPALFTDESSRSMGAA
jgi:hypothetical protein